MSDMKRSKVIYKRFGPNGMPKNTMVLIFADGQIFFGIARRNKKDLCVKAIGKAIASARAEDVMKTLGTCLDGCDCDGICFKTERQLAGHAKDTEENLLAIKTHFKKLR
jgi:hypothetical protein